MEYVFGTRIRGGVIQDVLRTKGDRHTDFKDTVQVEQVFDDAKIYDTFKVVKKYKSEKDREGNCYDWYIITGRYRYIDKYDQNIGKVEERIDGDIAETQDALCESTADLEERIADIEDALCELTE